MSATPGCSPDLLAGRRAMVTGAAVGIGQAICQALRAAGASVAAVTSPSSAAPSALSR